MKPHYKTVGEIIITNTLFALEESPAFSVAMKLLSKSFQGLPVLDRSGRVVGKVTEINLLKALKAGMNLHKTTVEEIMGEAPPVVGTETPLERAVEIMEVNQLVRLPVLNAGKFIGSVSRHDLLRAWLGVWMDHENGSYAEVIG
jgi:predicted transcriptional regulator